MLDFSDLEYDSQRRKVRPRSHDGSQGIVVRPDRLERPTLWFEAKQARRINDMQACYPLPKLLNFQVRVVLG
jgi:hypothetical protein